MAKTKQPKPENYAELQAELDNILAQLQRDDLDVDDALKHYQRGLELVGRMEKHLKNAENQVKRLRAKFNADAS